MKSEGDHSGPRPHVLREELDSFSRQHEGWIVSIITRSPKGDMTVAAREVHGHDGTTTTIEFRSPMRPEEVDGLPARNHQ
jgi:hypothetical protein